ncbi:guanine nucleotide exchange factor for Rab-3A isoform X12 [Canis lupus dingo]|uniref:guanine nucleotide exchange factor for Rab-3A isoform X12 n=1 Tax=Canis lupus dingo TaxID=286419 RepID=UPI0020C5A107|nr:guanine nucleotide exchange factor for Rab-3A isoform X12 [Canis lupus dingo]
MPREPDVGFDPGSPGSRPGPKAGAKPLRHPGIPCAGALCTSDPLGDPRGGAVAMVPRLAEMESQRISSSVDQHRLSTGCVPIPALEGVGTDEGVLSLPQGDPVLAHPALVTSQWQPRGQPHPDEGHPPPLETVPVSWKGCRESPGGPAESPAGEEAQGEDSPTAAQLDVLRLRSSSMEIREKGSEFLKEELHKAQKELQLKDEECERLSKVREQLEQELEELTASLFEEAHRMVREANMKQAASEKQLKEARGKIDMLQAEVTALKTLVLTSTPASPNRELHPQLLSPTKAGPRKGHLRHKSTSSALCPAMCPTAGHPLTPDKEGKELSALVRAAVEDNTLTIEPVASQTLPAVKVAAVECGSTNTCALSGLARACRHRIRLGDSESHYYISPSSRARITAVCNFFTYIRYIQQGLVRQEVEPMFWEITRLRKEMSLAKLGFFPQEA